jgi:replicative DNA helicase
MAYEGGPKVEAVLARAEDLILALHSGDKFRDFVHIRRLLEEYLETPGIDARGANLVGHVRTGFVDLDTVLGGLRRSDLIMLAARPSLGKTSLALNVARNAAIGQGARVAIFSLEMAAEQLAQRLLAGESGVDSTRLRLGEHNEAEERRIMHAMGVLAEAEIYIDDTAVQRVMEIRAKAHRLHREKQLDLIIVDYLQLMQGAAGRSDNRVAEVSDMSRALKGLARELDVPVLACSQLSRAPEQRVPHIPMLSDLRESGSLEQDADVVIFIYREDIYVTEEQWHQLHPDRPYPEGIAQIIVAKHRNGPTKTVNLRFRKNLTRFEDLAVLEAQPEYV